MLATIVRQSASSAALNPNSVRREAVVASIALSSFPAASRRRLFAAPGKVPLYLENVAAGQPEEFNGGHRAQEGWPVDRVHSWSSFDASGPPSATSAEADLMFFDGTRVHGRRDDPPGTRARKPDGAWATCRSQARTVRCTRSPRQESASILHINNTNPDPDRWLAASIEAVRAAGWDVAYDGMEFTL